VLIARDKVRQVGFDIHAFFRAVPRRVTFLSGKVTKAIGAGMTVSPTSGWLDSAALLAPSGPARTRTSVCSNSRALLPLGAAMLALTRRRPEAHFDAAIRGLHLQSALG